MRAPRLLREPERQAGDQTEPESQLGQGCVPLAEREV